MTVEEPGLIPTIIQGNRLSETNPEGGTTTYTYDKAGNLVSSTDEEEEQILMLTTRQEI